MTTKEPRCNQGYKFYIRMTKKGGLDNKIQEPATTPRQTDAYANTMPKAGAMLEVPRCGVSMELTLLRHIQLGKAPPINQDLLTTKVVAREQKHPRAKVKEKGEKHQKVKEKEKTKERARKEKEKERKEATVVEKESKTTIPNKNVMCVLTT